MIIECTHCRAKYQYDEARFERKPSKRIRCAKCQQVFEILNPAYVPPAEVELGDATAHARPRTLNEPLPEAHGGETSTTASSPIPRDPSVHPAGVGLPPKLPAGKRLSLAIINGPDSGKVFRIEKPRVVIGRSNADFVINDSESSRAHAAVVAHESLVTLEDLGSTNGTLVDGERIQRPVELTNHDEFQIGASTLMLIVTDEA